MTAAWESPAITSLLCRVLASHRHWTGALLADLRPESANVAELAYHAPLVLLAHDGGPDPRFTYANRQAQALWELDWTAFVGMPSRLSAEADHVAERQRLLDQARDHGVIHDYAGIRRSRTGRRFRIAGVCLWNVLDEQHCRIGQAAAFTQWTWLA